MNSTDTYYTNVIQAGDDASGSFKGACDEANKSSLAHHYGILAEDRSIVIDGNQFQQVSIEGMKESIDGVGTKVQIYCNQFENLYQELKALKISGEDCRNQCIELWTRMLMDLIAMNVDDLRDGELGIAATNIIDINHLKGDRGRLFQDTMAQAMKAVITETKIAMTAGETAILGQSHEASRLEKAALKILAQLEETLKPFSSELNIKDLFDNFRKDIQIIGEQISFNIGGTGLGLKLPNKLVPLDEGQIIIGLQERPIDGIIGPRSNGITKIRDYMNDDIMGYGRENKTFEDFVEAIGSKKAAKIPQDVARVCKGKKLRDIATGKTTVFNPFVADVLLGGLDSDPMVGLSRIIHVTGNPLKKISEGIQGKSDEYLINLDISGMPTPHIITLLQVALDIQDAEAMNKRNMGVPYALVCERKDAIRIISFAQQNGIEAKMIGAINKKESDDQKNGIAGVGLGNSVVEF